MRIKLAGLNGINLKLGSEDISKTLLVKFRALVMLLRKKCGTVQLLDTGELQRVTDSSCHLGT
jgi:hypothetical protein